MSFFSPISFAASLFVDQSRNRLVLFGIGFVIALLTSVSGLIYLGFFLTLPPSFRIFLDVSFAGKLSLLFLICFGSALTFARFVSWYVFLAVDFLDRLSLESEWLHIKDTKIRTILSGKRAAAEILLVFLLFLWFFKRFFIPELADPMQLYYGYGGAFIFSSVIAWKLSGFPHFKFSAIITMGRPRIFVFGFVFVSSFVPLFSSVSGHLYALDRMLFSKAVEMDGVTSELRLVAATSYGLIFYDPIGEEDLSEDETRWRFYGWDDVPTIGSK